MLTAVLTATYRLTVKADDTCTWSYTASNACWAETPISVTVPVPVAAVKQGIVEHFATLSPRWSKRIYVNGRRVNCRAFLKGIRAAA